MQKRVRGGGGVHERIEPVTRAVRVAARVRSLFSEGSECRAAAMEFEGSGGIGKGLDHASHCFFVSVHADGERRRAYGGTQDGTKKVPFEGR